MARESAKAIRDVMLMDEKGKTTSIDLWFVTDGSIDRYVAIDEATAHGYAEMHNRHITGGSDKNLRVECRKAKLT